MILEGLVTTTGPDGLLNLAPMGPAVGPGFDTFVLRPFRTSTTYRNLKHRGEGVLHVTDDALLMARSAVANVGDVETRPADRVFGRVLVDCCRYYEFRLTAVDDGGDRTSLAAETVHRGVVRDFFGFNRARHAVLEAAILATRAHFLPAAEVQAEIDKLRVIVGKTGGPAEHEAIDLLRAHVTDVARRLDTNPGSRVTRP